MRAVILAAATKREHIACRPGAMQENFPIAAAHLFRSRPDVFHSMNNDSQSPV
jgi:hypothetical protein